MAGNVVPLHEPLPRGGDASLGTASKMMWDVLFDLEPATADELTAEYGRRAETTTGLGGYLLRNYASYRQGQAKRVGDVYYEVTIHNIHQAVRRFVIQWLGTRRRNGQVGREGDRYISTSQHGKIRDPLTGKRVDYTPERSHAWRAGAKAAMREQATMMTVRQLTEDMTAGEVGELLLMATRATIRDAVTRSGGNLVYVTRIDASDSKHVAGKAKMLLRQLRDTPDDTATIRLLVDRWEELVEATS